MHYDTMANSFVGLTGIYKNHRIKITPHSHYAGGA